MKFPFMTAQSSLGPTSQQYVVKTTTAKSEAGYMHLAAQPIQIVKKVVGQGAAYFAKTGTRHEISSGKLTLCSFATVRITSKQGVIKGYMFVHHGQGPQESLTNKINQEFQNNNIDPNQTVNTLVSMQTAPSTEHMWSKEKNPLKAVETAVPRDTDLELREILANVNVENAAYGSSCNVKAEIAQGKGTVVEVASNGEANTSGAAKSCCIL